MKLAALIVLIVGNLAVSHAFADDLVPQPLTRADCDKAAMAWDDNANVCVAGSEAALSQPLTRSDCGKAGRTWNDNAHMCEFASQEPKTMPSSEAANSSGQPLTRKDCGEAGMAWNDAANVCGEKTERQGAQAASTTTNPGRPTILITIDKATQKMTVAVDGAERYRWPVSTGKFGYSTPSGTYTPTSMNEVWYSKQWDNAPMPHAIFFMKDGHAIHGSYEVKHLGNAVSHGCVRIAPKNATILYDLVKKTGMENTQVVLSGDTPGGESKSASSAKPRPPSLTRSTNYFADSDAQPQRRGGFFRRLFGGR